MSSEALIFMVATWGAIIVAVLFCLWRLERK